VGACLDVLVTLVCGTMGGGSLDNVFPAEVEAPCETKDGASSVNISREVGLLACPLATISADRGDILRADGADEGGGREGGSRSKGLLATVCSKPCNCGSFCDPYSSSTALGTKSDKNSMSLVESSTGACVGELEATRGREKRLKNREMAKGAGAEAAGSDFGTTGSEDGKLASEYVASVPCGKGTVDAGNAGRWGEAGDATALLDSEVKEDLMLSKLDRVASIAMSGLGPLSSTGEATFTASRGTPDARRFHKLANRLPGFFVLSSAFSPLSLSFSTIRHPIGTSSRTTS